LTLNFTSMKSTRTLVAARDEGFPDANRSTES
jgi:hypothetical protein